MMKEWFLSTELIGLDTMPGTIAGISQKAKRENWKSRKAKGGGRSLEYHICNFNDDIIQQLNSIYPDQTFYSGKNSNLATSDAFKAPIPRYAQEQAINELIDTGKFEELKKYIHLLLEQPMIGDLEFSDHVELDFYDVGVSDGHSSLVLQEDECDCLIFSSKFFDDEIGVNIENVFLMPVKGDSMAPTLRGNAIVMVNRVEAFYADGIYVFKFGSQIMIKRLQFTKTGLNVVSDNTTTYEPWKITHEEISSGNFELIGEVVWSGQKV